MEKPKHSRVKVRLRTAVLVLLVVPLVGWLAIQWAPWRGTSAVGTAVDQPPEGRPAPANETSAVGDDADDRSVVGGDRAPVDAAADSDAQQRGASELDTQVWDLVERLRVLARDPGTFHREALEVIASLGEAVVRAAPEKGVGENEQDSALEATTGPGGRLLAELLMERVVHSLGESDLVRGAVLLAVAPLLQAQAFQPTFDAWLGEPATSHELLRAATFAAALRGEEAGCLVPLLPGRLAQLPSDGTLSLPPFYSLRLNRVVEPYEASVLQSWLKSGDPRADRFVLGAPPPEGAVERQELAQYAVTAELIFAIWGHRALFDPEVRRVLTHEALLDENGKWSPSLVYFRVASFLVHSLAPCNQGLAETATRMGSSGNPLVQGIAELVREVSARGLSPDLLAQIEGLRYSAEPYDQGELALLLIDLGEDLGDLAGTDPWACEEACFYLDQLVQDPSMPESGRATALTAIESSGRLDAIVESAGVALQSNAPDAVAAVALGMLMQVAREHESYREHVLAVLHEAKLGEPRTWMSSNLDASISELSR